MSLKEEIKQIVREDKQDLKNSKDYIKLLEFYQTMVKMGLVKKEKYNIPPMDTIGKIWKEKNSNFRVFTRNK